jgi:hypothetical protein
VVVVVVTVTVVELSLGGSSLTPVQIKQTRINIYLNIENVDL